MGAFPDVADIICDVAEARDDVAAAGTVVPADLQDQLVYVHVHCFGGTDDRITDYPRVDVHVFATTYVAARDVAQGLREQFMATPIVNDLGIIDRVDTVTRPFESPWADPDIHRFTASYRMHARRSVSA
jgi:hypothetical protein